jgi:hypothetical protein
MAWAGLPCANCPFLWQAMGWAGLVLGWAAWACLVVGWFGLAIGWAGYALCWDSGRPFAGPFMISAGPTMGLAATGWDGPWSGLCMC